MDYAHLIDKALANFGMVLSKAQDGDWTKPTPCTEWDVRALTNHAVGEAVWIPDLLEGKTLEQIGDQYDGDILGDNPYHAWMNAYDKVRRAAYQEGALDTQVHLSRGLTPAKDYLAEMIADQTVHTWDLAKGLGLEGKMDAELLDFTYTFFKKEAENWRKGGAFKDEIKVPDSADDQTKLLAITGRRRDWQPPKSA